MPQISVIIPNYNHEPFLKLRIESVLNQTFQDFELIILDDNSTDNSRSIIEQYRDHEKISRIIYNTKNSGSTFIQWEKGFALAKSDWVWIAESDDYSDPEFLSSLIVLTNRYDNLGIVLTNSYRVNDEQRVEDIYEYMTCAFMHGITEVKKRLCYYNTITNVSACLINRKMALKAVKGLGKYKTCGDWIFYTRLLQYSNLAYSPQKLNYYRWHPKNISYSASKNGTYVTEGINVIEDIDYNLVRFSTREFLALGKGWLKKISDVQLKYSFKPLVSIIIATVKFSAAKLNIAMHS